MALSYIMDLKGSQMNGRKLGAPMSFWDWVKKQMTPLPPIRQPGEALHGPWQTLNQYEAYHHNTIVPASIAPNYAGGIPMEPGYNIRPQVFMPTPPTPRPLQGSGLGGITDVIMGNPVALLLGAGVGIYLALHSKKK